LCWLEGHATPEKLTDGSVLWHGYIWDITERKHLEAMNQREVQRERMIGLIDDQIGKSLDLEQILKTTVAEVRQFLATDRVLVYRMQPNWSGVVVAESVAPGWISILAQKITDSYLVETQGGCYQDNHCNVVNDIYSVGFSPCHIELLEGMQVRAKLVIPILQGETCWGLLIAHHCRAPRQWQDIETRLLQKLASQLALSIQNAELYHQLETANQDLEQQSNTDALTQIHNRRYFDQTLIRTLHQAQRAGQPLSLILCDVDYFKQYNDTYGHPAGDACLMSMAAALQRSLKRHPDSLARYGGEEFGIILPNTDQAGAIAVVEAMQGAIASLSMEHRTHLSCPWVTLSFGITSLVPSFQTSPQMLLDQADQALYEGKAAGRNCYSLFSGS
jgi:diguanylate cyclase (GGDEF)-like protein